MSVGELSVILLLAGLTVAALLHLVTRETSVARGVIWTIVIVAFPATGGLSYLVSVGVGRALRAQRAASEPGQRI